MKSRWLFGPAPDLLLGCGLLWMGSFALQGFVGSDRLSTWLPGGFLVMAAAIPHYGGTLLRVYESADDRRKYAFFTVYATLGLAVLYAVGLHSALAGSLLLTLYLTWSPWHYTGQNYGVALMLMGRRGVKVSPLAKRWLYASFVLSYLLTFVAIHGAERAANYAPVSYSGTVFHLLPLGIPTEAVGIIVPALAVGYAVALGVALVLLGRGGRAAALLPAVVLMGTQALWFSVPVIARFFGWVDASSFFANVFTPYGFIWIAAGHSVQYLWVTSYYARTSGAESRILPYLGKAALAGYAIWTLPALLFAPNLLGGITGSPPYESGLALMTAAIVNLHHFVLDGAIWKLRDGRIGRVLLRSERGAEAGAPIVPERSRWRAAPVWVACGVAVVVAVVAAWEDFVGHQRAMARNDLFRVRQAAERLRLLGRDGPVIHREIGRALTRDGQADGARRAYEESLAVFPTAGAWLDLASLEDAQGNTARALECRESALAMEPDNLQALYDAGLAELRLGRPERAIPYLERAAELAPDQKLIGVSLARARRLAEESPGS